MEVKIGFCIEKQIVTAICFKQNVTISRDEFLGLQNDEIYKLLFAYAIPETASEWRKIFESSVQLARSKERYNATSSNFDKLYEDTQVFITSFRELITTCFRIMWTKLNE